MLIAILTLLCIMFFFNLLFLGELVLIKRKLYQKQIRQLPVVKPDILRTLAEEIEKIKRAGKQEGEGRRWADELITEQPCLAKYLEVMASKEGDFDVRIAGTVMYRLLKAQAEADSLADLTKIQK